MNNAISGDLHVPHFLQAPVQKQTGVPLFFTHVQVWEKFLEEE
jgi:hypothetical protein